MKPFLTRHMICNERTILDGNNSIMIWPMNHYFTTIGADSDWEEMCKLIDWVDENFEENTWMWDGITLFSYRFFFVNPEDATLFKLKFGV